MVLKTATMRIMMIGTLTNILLLNQMTKVNIMGEYNDKELVAVRGHYCSDCNKHRFFYHKEGELWYCQICGTEVVINKNDDKKIIPS